ncbi:hypothetical protein Tco_0157605 [Tanacetum coccineum]
MNDQGSYNDMQFHRLKGIRANVSLLLHKDALNVFLASGLQINIHKSKLMGIGVSHKEVKAAANIIGCSTFSSPFNYLGVKVGMSSSRRKSWDEVLDKISSRLSKWKIKTLSIDGRLTLIKSVLTSLPLYHMSIHKAPMGVLHTMESFRRRFFNGVDKNEIKISMIALLFKWVWRFLSHDTTLWSRFITALNGERVSFEYPGHVSRPSPWNTIIRELDTLSFQGINLHAHLRKKVGNGVHTLFWEDTWITDIPLSQTYPQLYALENKKHITVAEKLSEASLIVSFRRAPRGGMEEEQFLRLVDLVASVILSNSNDRWVLAGESCSHILFSCSMARLLWRKPARWWDFNIPEFSSYEDWIAWFNSIRISKVFKDVLEGLFYVMWDEKTFDTKADGSVFTSAKEKPPIPEAEPPDFTSGWILMKPQTSPERRMKRRTILKTDEDAKRKNLGVQVLEFATLMATQCAEAEAAAAMDPKHDHLASL